MPLSPRTRFGSGQACLDCQPRPNGKRHTPPPRRLSTRSLGKADSKGEKRGGGILTTGARARSHSLGVRERIPAPRGVFLEKRAESAAPPKAKPPRRLARVLPPSLRRLPGCQASPGESWGVAAASELTEPPYSPRAPRRQASASSSSSSPSPSRRNVSIVQRPRRLLTQVRAEGGRAGGAGKRLLPRCPPLEKGEEPPPERERGGEGSR